MYLFIYSIVCIPLYLERFIRNKIHIIYMTNKLMHSRMHFSQNNNTCTNAIRPKSICN